MGSSCRRRRRRAPRRSHPRFETTYDPLVLADLRGRAAAAVEPQYRTVAGQVTRCWRAAAACDYRTANELAAIVGIVRALADCIGRRVSLPENVADLRRIGAAMDRAERLEKSLRAGASGALEPALAVPPRRYPVAKSA